MRREPSRAAGSGDESGCLLLVLLLLWYFGFVTFHSRERGRSIAQLDAVSAQLGSAKSEIANLSQGIAALRIEHDSLEQRGIALATQVVALERTRDALSASLAAADSIISPARQSAVQRTIRALFSGVPGNLAAAAIVALIALLARRVMRSRRQNT